MKYYRLYFKHENGEYINHYYNVRDGEHPLDHARLYLSHYYDEIPEFKKRAGKEEWRLNGTHRHPFFAFTEGVWYLEYSHVEYSVF